MPKPKEVSGWKVRVVLDGAILHVLSEAEPVVHHNATGTEVTSVDWKLITATEDGDTVGFIRWSHVSAITWRKG